MEQIQFIQTTPEVLIKKIESIVEDLRADFADIKIQPQSDDLLTRQQTADYLQIDKSTLWAWTRKGKLSSYGIGNRVYYRLSEVDEALKPLNKIDQ